MKCRMTTCVDCGDDHMPLLADPRNPPLDEGLCLCTDCYESAVLEVLDASLDEMRRAVELCVVVRDPLRTIKLQQLIDMADNV